MYPKLIKAYNGAKQFAKADSVFGIMKNAYNKKELPKDDMQFKHTGIEEYEWKGQKITIHKYFEEPKEMLDISYKIYLLNKEGDKVERTFMIEKTIELPDGPKHLLCEKDKKTGTHSSYPYGWATDNIPLEDIKKAVGLILDGKMNPSASSNFGDR